MRMNRIRKRRSIATIIILFILGFVFFSAGYKKCNDIIYTYKENNSVEYKVFLKPNDFFDTPYLEKDKTYITSLIDYIDTDFKYNISFNEKVSGNINYKIYAEIRADKNNNDIGNYWTKKYEITAEEQNSINNKDSHEINVNHKIDYNKYNDLLNSFIKEYGLQTDSTLKVYMEVIGNVKVDKTEEQIDIKSELSLTIPLSKLAVEGKIETQSNNNEKEIIRKASEIEPYRKLAKVLFVIVLVLFVYNLIRYAIFLSNKDNYLNYRDRIKKINADYEELITKVKAMNKGDFAVIDVETFDDLINVYASIREPINFLYGNEESKYFIIKGNTCYMYTIVKEEINNHGK